MSAYRRKWFPAMAGLLWVTFLFLDLTHLADSTWVKYASICLCCLTALLGAKTTDGRLVAAALCLTLAADWFLLVRNDNYALGITLFIVVQLIYAFRLSLMGDRPFSSGPLAVRFLGLGTAALLAWKGSAVNALAAFYFSNLLANGLASRHSLHQHPLRRRFSRGLTLFLLCDLCVGAYNLNLLPALTSPGMWFFYLPSQVLIVLSQETETGDLDETKF